MNSAMWPISLSLSCSPTKGLSPLMKDLTVAICVMQNSSNELSTPVSVSIMFKHKKKINTCISYSLTYFEAAHGCEVMLSG